MPDFYGDNPDIGFLVRNMDLADVVSSIEDDYAQAKTFDYAPVDLADAVDNYDRVLSMLGQMSGDFIDVRAEDVDLIGAKLVSGGVAYAPGTADAVRQLGKADLMGFTLPRCFGGLNFPGLIYTAAIEIVSRADAALMNIFGLQGIADTVNEFASEEIRSEYLPRFSRGEVTAAMALTEPDAGSDLQAVQLKAIPGESEGLWYLNGVKRFITNGCGEVLLVLARSEPDSDDGRGLSLFVCDRGPTIKVRRLENKLGIHGSPTCELQFNMTPARLIGERRLGLIRYTMSMMNGARLGIAAQSLGIAEAAYREALAYAHTREQFGRPIKDFPAVAEMLVEMKTKIEAGRVLTYQTALVVDRERALEKEVNAAKEAGDKDRLKEARGRYRKYGKLASLLTPLSKYYCSEMCNQVAYDAIQVLGGSGYMKDYKLDRLYRDARITTIYEGTSQLQVLAAITGLMSGSLNFGVEEIDLAGLSEELLELKEPLDAGLKLMNESVAALKARGDRSVIDLYARSAVDMAIDVMCGYLLLWSAARDERKRVVARKWLAEAVPRMHMNAERIAQCDKTTLTEFNVLTEEREVVEA